MRLTNKFNLPAPIVRAVTKDPYDRGPATFSVSNIIDSPRAQTLQWKHDQEIVEDVSDRVFSLLGRAVHQILEWGATDEQETAEERLFMDVTVGGTTVTVSGAMDLQQAPLDGVVDISDYKVTSVYGFQADKEAWHNQLNCYAHLVRRAQKRGFLDREGKWRMEPRSGANVGHLSIVAILRDWSSGKAKTTADYPPAAIQEIDIPLWPVAEAERYFLERVKLHVKARSADFAGKELPLCTKVERWEDDPKFAVMKAGNKRATAVFEDHDNALEFIRQSNDKDKLSVQARGAEPRRCVGDWCRVSQWCSQRQRDLEAERTSDNAS